MCLKLLLKNDYFCIKIGKNEMIKTTRPTATSEEKPFKNFGQKGAWAYQGIAPIFMVSLIISGKAKNFKFCTHIHRIDRNKEPRNVDFRTITIVLGVLFSIFSSENLC